MIATPVRAFSQSAARMSGQSNTSATKWFGTFFGVTGILFAFGGVFWKFNENNSIKAGFEKHGLTKKPVA